MAHITGTQYCVFSAVLLVDIRKDTIGYKLAVLVPILAILVSAVNLISQTPVYQQA